MPSEYKVTRRVEFSETDMAGIMHFSNYFKFMETAEHAFFRSLGLSVVPKPGGPPVGFPRVSATCEFKKPLKYEEEVEIHLKVAAKTDKAVTYNFIFKKAGDADECARGSMTVVCCVIGNGRMQATPMPKEYADKIEVAAVQ